ncbi:hypothetical protein [Marivita hallyeonensis]|uniref:Uncharacterized protein n=1 Tax=Marivita hallyeonensis TaxID=996342 RepID=A0A1M5RC33_9RHOB|nr:hypothetical protein [Marivita hallyeonensis]SHH23904.1 hypothetical protein SAMN05443551_1701 [Marivita hallyeonensis]
MRRTIRKQTQADFNDRIRRLDPKFAKAKPTQRMDVKPWEVEKKRRETSESPIMMTGLGCALVLSALYGLQNPDTVRDLLLQSGWPGEFLTYAMNGLTIMAFGLVFFFLGNMFRIFNPRATGRRNAAGLVVGAIAGVVLFNSPGSYVDSAYAAIGVESIGEIFAFAQQRGTELASVDWSSVKMVSSDGK